MDSFYDAPRRPPQPIPRETFAATPVVPEISVLCPTNTAKNTFTPYNQWKDTVHTNYLMSNKENNSNFQNTQNNSILKKQVRFESPVLQQRPLSSNEQFLNQIDHSRKNYTQNDKKPYAQSEVLPSFEQMYMANIPNRQLDLSVIDLPKRPANNNNQYLDDKVFKKEDNMLQCKKTEQPKSYREFLNSQKMDNKIILNDSVTDIFNYKTNTINGQSLTPKVKHNVHEKFMRKESPELSSNKYQPSLNDLRNENNNAKNPQENSETYFNHVTEAISQRNLPIRPQNTKSPVIPKKSNYNTNCAEQNADPIIGTPQKFWFENPNCIRSQNKLMSPNQSKNNTQEMEHIFRTDTCEDTKNKYSPGKFEAQKFENNRVFLGTQVDEGSETSRATLNSNVHTQDNYNTSIYPIEAQKKRECYTQTSNELSLIENNELRKKCDKDLSVKDLLKIVAQQSQQMAQQNEQILLLQRQVSELVFRQNSIEDSKQKSIECGQERNCCQYSKNSYDRPRYCCGQERLREQCCVPEFRNKIHEKCITSTQHEHCNGIKPQLETTPKKNKNNLQNFSIGLTTSFEVSFRKAPYNKKNKQLPDSDHYEPPKIQEITDAESTNSNENYRRNYQQDFQEIVENDNKETLVDASMVFKEPIRVTEPCPSPEPSIKIDMKDFEDSESDDDSTSSKVGPSFYRNLMVQVNKILQKAQIETTEEVAYNFKGQHLKNETLHKVKEATLKQLRKIGVEVQHFDDSSHSGSLSDGMDSKSYDQDDISFAVKQLLMKYLPADHLAKIAHKEVQYENRAVLTPKEKQGAIKNRPDFSFATVQYMKKYNLIANNQKDLPRPNQTESPKILDISKLKQQPKLL